MNAQPRFRLLTLEELEDLPDLIWLIEGILPQPCLAVLYGDPGCGKTFVALSMALAAAAGRDWLGRRCQHTYVLYIAAEGARGIKYRVAADRSKKGPVGHAFRLLDGAPNLLDPKDVEALGAILESASLRPRLIVVDTLARVTTGADENNARDMGVAVEALDALKTAFGAAVLVLHHKTKNGGSERGSSALRGAADVMIECKKTEDLAGPAVILNCSKMKDDEPFKEMTVALERVDLSDGRSSLVLSHEVETQSLGGSLAKAKILELLETHFAETGATNKQIWDAFESAGYGSKSTFGRGLQAAKESGKLREEGVSRGKKYFPLIAKKSETVPEKN